MSRRELIMLAIVATLEAAGTPAAVHRFRTRPIESEKLDDEGAIVVYPAPSGEAVKAEDHEETVVRRLLVRCECRALAAPDTPADQAVDPLLTWCTRRMISDRTLGGLAQTVRERAVQWAAEQKSQGVFAAGAVDFEVEYDTDEDNPETLYGA